MKAYQYLFTLPPGQAKLALEIKEALSAQTDGTSLLFAAFVNAMFALGFETTCVLTVRDEKFMDKSLEIIQHYGFIIEQRGEIEVSDNPEEADIFWATVEGAYMGAEKAYTDQLPSLELLKRLKEKKE